MAAPVPRKVVAVLGYGPGISSAVAAKFAREGFSVALVSRTQAKLDAAAKELREAHGVEAVGLAADLDKPEEVKSVLSRASAALGHPITVLFYNPPSAAFGDVLTIPLDSVSASLNNQVTSLIAAVQAVVPGQEGQVGAAILITGGGLSLAADIPWVANLAPKIGGVVVAAGKAAQRNITFTLAEQLKPKGIRVAEVVVVGAVKGSEDSAVAGVASAIDPVDVAADFWSLYSDPAGPVSVQRSS